MNEIQGKARTIRELLSGAKYSVDYYQREYKWGEKQIQELIDDLTEKFLGAYEEGDSREAVESYSHYFLGSIIISRKDNLSFIVDGQQRLTTLTLLLIYLHNLQKERGDEATLSELIYSKKYGKRSFNIHVDERAAGMDALFQDQPFDTSTQPESVQNIVAQYENIKRFFPEELTGAALPYFVDWLTENVHLVEITAYSDEDAYTIFETMNDRGLSLSPVEMLKGYLLANINDSEKRTKANERWKQRVQQLLDLGKEVDADFFKAWLRSQYAESIRERKRGATPEDFDRIGSEFHRWVRDEHDRLGLNGSPSYAAFIERDFEFYSRHYRRLVQATRALMPGLEHVFYNAQHGFTMQLQVLLAPVCMGDAEEVLTKKLRLMAMYLNMLLTRRLWNYRSISYSTLSYAMFQLIRDTRGKEPPELAAILRERLEEAPDEFNDRFAMHKQNRAHIHLMLARMTDYVEQGSGMASRYLEYTTGKGSKRYEVEHIWANVPERHRDEFAQRNEFEEYRNHIGDLLLLPKSFNASYGAAEYEKKLPHYNSAQNLLARSLHPQCYEHNPGFKAFIERSGLPFQPHHEFHKADLDARQELYRRIAEQVWDPRRLTDEVGL